MPLLLRRTLIRLLLLAVFFNTVIGSVAHEAEHLEHSVAAAVAAQSAAEHADDPEHEGQAHGACAWCLAFAHPGIAHAAVVTVHALVASRDLARPQARGVFVPNPGHWRFASRDPPHTSA